MSESSPQYVIWGSAGHAKVLASLISLVGGQVVALFDRQPVPPALSGVPLHLGLEGFEAWSANAGNLNAVRGLVAIGGHRGRDRIAIQQLFATKGLCLAPLVHPSAALCPTASIGPGSQILAQAVVAAETRIGAACIVNHRASVDHECHLGDGVHIAPGATLCGCVTIGDNVLVGAGAVVLPRLAIGSDAIIGAGAVVTRNVAPGSIVAGTPARALTPCISH